MEILICQTCGAILRGQNANCPTCGTVVSRFSPTSLPLMSHGSSALQVKVSPDPLLMERVVARRQVAAVLERPPENGSGGGSGSGRSEPTSNEPRELDFAPAPDLVSKQPPSESVANAPSEQPPASGFAPGGMLSSAVSAPAAAGGFPVWTGAAAGAVASTATGALFSGATAPEPVVPDGKSAGTESAQAFAQMSQAAQSAQPKPSDVDQPADFFAVQAPVEDKKETAAAHAPAQDYELAQRSEFFASKGTSEEVKAPIAAAAVEAAPAENPAPATAQAALEANSAVTTPAPANEAKPAESKPTEDKAAAQSAQAKEASSEKETKSKKKSARDDDDDIPPPTAPSKKDPPPIVTPDAFDFFASSKFKPSAKEASSERSKIERKAPSLFSDDVSSKPKRRPSDDDDDVPKVAAPLGYKPKDSSVSLKQVDDRDEDQQEDDDDDDDRKVVSKSKQKTKLAKVKAKAAPVDDDDDDAHADEEHEDDSEDSSDKPPPRRSFTSGGGSKSKAVLKKSKKKSVKDDDDDDDHEHDDDSESAPSKPGLMGMLEQEVKFLGLTMSRLNSIILCGIGAFVVVVVISAGMSVLGNFGNPFTPAGPPPVTIPNLSGNWGIEADYDEGNTHRKTLGRMTVTENPDSSLKVSGSDQLRGRQVSFAMAGRLSGDHIVFSKYYFMRDDQTGEVVPDKPINLDGKVLSKPGEPLLMQGYWTKKVSVGHFLNHKVKILGGFWKAEMEQAVANATTTTTAPANGFQTATSGFQSGVAPGPGVISAPPMPGQNLLDGQPMQNKFLIAAVGILFLVFGMIGMSLALFGPGGKMNIWEKQKYIPTQFRAQHKKMRADLAKPLKPGGLPLGQRYEWAAWKPWEFGAKDLCMPPGVRRRDPHILVLGGGDKGKTRMIAKMITHDIQSNDRAVVVIDSDGGLIDLITRWIAAEPKGKDMAKRVTILDPTDRRHVQKSYNPLEMPEDGNLQSAADSIVSGFKAIYTEPPGAQSQWNAQTANILRNCALLLMANGKTLTDLPSLLNDNDFRDVLLEAVEKDKDARAEFITLLDTWGQYKKLARTDQWITWCEPILNRVTPMLGDSRIRNILTNPVSDVNLTDLIEKKKILLVKVAKGQLGQNANLLGSLIVTGIKQAATSINQEAPEKQNPVALYLDEFDDFIEKDTIEAITSETDKMQIGFVGLMKTLQHLPEDFRNQIVINVGTCCVFALAKKDGDVLGPQMFRVDGRKIKHQTIQNFFNKVNTSPQFELIADEEKLNIDRVVGQEARTFYCYRVGTVAGVFHMRAHDFNDIPDKKVNNKLLEKMRGEKLEFKSRRKRDDDDE